MSEVLAFDENHTSLTKKSIRFLFLLCVFLTTKARMDGWMDGWMDRWMDGWMDG